MILPSSLCSVAYHITLLFLLKVCTSSSLKLKKFAKVVNGYLNFFPYLYVAPADARLTRPSLPGPPALAGGCQLPQPSRCRGCCHRAPQRHWSHPPMGRGLNAALPRPPPPLRLVMRHRQHWRPRLCTQLRSGQGQCLSGWPRTGIRHCRLWGAGMRRARRRLPWGKPQPQQQILGTAQGPRTAILQSGLTTRAQQ